MAITITTPVAYRVFQRSGTTGSIAITGTYTGSPTAIEASFNGGAYAVIVASPAGGTYSGTLSGQAQGMGVLTVRFSDLSSTANVNSIGIGDVYLVAGQSNACGETTNNNVYYHAYLKAGEFGNDYNWKQLVDPLDSNSGQVDSVSSDSVGGACWLVLATYLMQNQGVPVAMVPCAKVGSVIADWQPGADHQNRATLYGSMNYRGQQTGCKAVLWWQGESDSVNATAQATYNSNLDTLANAVNSDLGVKLIVCKIFALDQSPWTSDNTAVNAAIATAWGDNSNVLTGPDLSDLAMSKIGGIHYGNDIVYLIASRWFHAMRLAYGWTKQNGCIQSANNWAATNTAVPFPVAVTSGNLIVVAVTQYGGTTVNGSSISDGSNTYHLIGSVTSYSGDSSFRLALYYAYNVTGGTLTVTCTANGTPTVSIHEYEGITTSDPLDKYTEGTYTDNTAPPDSGSVLITQANELLFAAAGLYTAGLDFISPGTGYALREVFPLGDSQNSQATEDRQVSAIGTYKATMGQSQDFGWILKIAAFKRTATAYSPNTPIDYSLFPKPLMQGAQR